MTKKVRIRTLGRIISDLADFGLYGVAGMLINGELNVFWSTGVDATSTLEYGINDSDPNNFLGVSLSGVRKHHQIPFPETFVATDHFFRVRSTNPITGVEKVSAIYRVFVSDTLAFESKVGGTSPLFLEITVADTKQTLKGLIASIGDLSTTPDASNNVATLSPTFSALSIPDHNPNKPLTLDTNILTTTVA